MRSPSGQTEDERHFLVWSLFVRLFVLCNDTQVINCSLPTIEWNKNFLSNVKGGVWLGFQWDLWIFVTTWHRRLHQQHGDHNSKLHSSSSPLQICAPSLVLVRSLASRRHRPLKYMLVVDWSLLQIVWCRTCPNWKWWMCLAVNEIRRWETKRKKRSRLMQEKEQTTWRSSSVSLLSWAFLTNSFTRLEMVANPLRSASLITGVKSPRSVLTATLISTEW